MTKPEIKKTLEKLVNEFLTSSDINVLVKKRVEILDTFSSSNFKVQSKETTTITSTLVGNDMAKYIQSVSTNTMNPEIKLETNTSLVLLLTMHDAFAI